MKVALNTLIVIALFATVVVALSNAMNKAESVRVQSYCRTPYTLEYCATHPNTYDTQSK